MAKDLLFEIGTEELPAKIITKITKQLKEIVTKKLKENNLTYKKVDIYSTPRRLAVIVNDLTEKQLDKVELKKGPAKKNAYKNGEPTNALLGFMKGNNVNENDIEIKEIKGVEYIHAKICTKGKFTKDILKMILPSTINAIVFKKTMRWNHYKIRFSRPIRWLVSLFGEDVIKFDFEGVEVSNYSMGHRTLTNKKIVISKPTEYLEVMKNNFVIANPFERKEIILKQIKEIEKNENCSVKIGNILMDEIINLVEYPTAFIGSFEKEYLDLPKEVIVTPMKEHQKYFPVCSVNENNLINKFVAVRNGNNNGLDIVRVGNERVLRARLKDAQFFYNEDLKEKLENKVFKLKDIVYKQELGTIYDKVMRFSKIALFIGNELGFSKKELVLLKRTALLSKADLTTNMVCEFDELQGVIGKRYAFKNGEDEKVANGIFTHYLPRNANDNIPNDNIGIALSIADKIDSILGSFCINEKPTGSQDPYGIRRNTLGIIKIMLGNKIDLDLIKIMDMSVDLLDEKICFENANIANFSKISVKNSFYMFLIQRYKLLLTKEYKFRHDVVDSIIGTDLPISFSILNKFNKVEFLDNVVKTDATFKETATALSRAFNITKNVKLENKNIDTTLFENDYEANLYKAYQLILNQFLDDKNSMEELLIAIKELVTPINSYFDNIMVNVDDNKLKENRMKQLFLIKTLAHNICNFDILNFKEEVKR